MISMTRRWASGFITAIRCSVSSIVAGSLDVPGRAIYGGWGAFDRVGSNVRIIGRSWRVFGAPSTARRNA